MTIVNVGLSHRFAPAEVLEKLAVPSAELGDVLTRLHTVPSIDEVVVLSTCNRVEVYAAASGPAEQVTRAVAGLVASRGRLRTGEVLRMARTRVGGAAAEHLFCVACGLDSMAIGEDQIVAQLKAAARAAATAGTAGPVMTGLIDAALRASKRARTQTAISTEGISLARAGLEVAARTWAAPPRTWAASPTAMRWFWGREPRAGSRRGSYTKPVSRGCQWPAVTRREPRRWPRRCAPGICRPATCLPRSPTRTCWSPPPGPPRPSWPRGRCGRPGPRLAAGRCSCSTWACRLMWTRPWGGWPGSNSSTSPHSAGTWPTERYRTRSPRSAPLSPPRPPGTWTGGTKSAAAPVIAAMHAQIRQFADAELARLHHRLPDLSEEQRAETAATVHRILRKVLHRPTVRAKEFSAGPEGPVYLDVLRQLFDLRTDKASA